VTQSGAARNARLHVVPFREDVIDMIAATIGAAVSLAPFQLPGASVHQMIVEGARDKPSALVTLWPSLRRVDAIGSGVAVVFTRIATVQLVNDVEILFRRESGEFLVVAKGGRIVVRS
jgi:hypothetical protein